MQEDYKIFMPIDRYSKERKIFLIDWIERITWDASCDPEYFLELLKNDGYGKQWALCTRASHLATLRIGTWPADA